MVINNTQIADKGMSLEDSVIGQAIWMEFKDVMRTASDPGAIFYDKVDDPSEVQDAVD